MKRFLPLLLSLLLLSGCAAQSPQTRTELVSASTGAETAGLYDPGSALEAQTGGALRCYPLGGTSACSLVPLGEDWLLLSPAQTGTALCHLEGDTAVPTASTSIPTVLSTADPTLQTVSGGIAWFDTANQETVVLDGTLTETCRIPAPEGLLGTPLLSRDGNTLYYATGTAFRALDLTTGISRVLKEAGYPDQQVTGLWLAGSVLECRIFDGGQWEVLLLSTETGQTLQILPDTLIASASDTHVFAQLEAGAVPVYAFGTREAPAQALTPATLQGELFFLPEQTAAVQLTRPQEGCFRLTYYDLVTGRRTGELTLESDYRPWGFQPGQNGQVWFLNYDQSYSCNTLYCWDPALTPLADSTVYTGPCFTRENPDREGLAACSAFAGELSRRYGVEVLIHQDAIAVQPGDYRMESEYRATLLMRELEQLDRCLSHYPEGFLPTLAQRFDGLSICLVQSLTGCADQGSLDSANGIQFWDGYHAYVALAVGTDTEKGLYHELCHLIDTIVLTQSSAYDTWDSLNPTGFQYDNDYVANQSRNATAYLQDATRSFIDMYAMSFPKEDRARIMEYAMTEGNAHLFQSDAMQKKLRTLCTGIREAFGLEDSQEIFLWEQYLS